MQSSYPLPAYGSSCVSAEILISPSTSWPFGLNDQKQIHIVLCYHSIDPRCFPDLTSPVERWESFILRVKEEWVQQIPLSCARRLKFLCANSPIRETPEDIVALIPNLQSLCIKFEMGLHCAYTRSIMNNISHFRFCRPLLYCEWRMLRHFRGTVLDLSFVDPASDEP